MEKKTTNEKLGGLAKSYTMATLLFSNLPKVPEGHQDYPLYKLQQDTQNYVVGALMGGWVVGFILGLILGVVF